MYFFHRLFTMMAALLGIVSAAQAQTVITSLPYTITASGTYVLNQNLSSSQTSGNLIEIKASNVTIDFKGHYIAGPVVNSDQGNTGIVATERSNLTIKNGTIAYCLIGINLIGNGDSTTNNVNHRIDGMRVTYCTFIGVHILQGPASRITNCQVSQFGSNAQSLAYGIAIEGPGTTIQSNVVSAISGLPVYGIYADPGNFVQRNTISNAYYGVYGGKYQDNLTAGCTTPFSGGTNAGGNN